MFHGISVGDNARSNTNHAYGPHTRISLEIILNICRSWKLPDVSGCPNEHEAAVLHRIYLNLTMALTFCFPDWKCLIMLLISAGVREEWLLWFPVGRVGGVEDGLGDALESSMSLKRFSELICWLLMLHFFAPLCCSVIPWQWQCLKVQR